MGLNYTAFLMILFLNDISILPWNKIKFHYHAQVSLNIEIKSFLHNGFNKWHRKDWFTSTHSHVTNSASRRAHLHLFYRTLLLLLFCKRLIIITHSTGSPKLTWISSVKWLLKEMKGSFVPLHCLLGFWVLRCWVYLQHRVFLTIYWSSYCMQVNRFDHKERPKMVLNKVKRKFKNNL